MKQVQLNIDEGNQSLPFLPQGDYKVEVENLRLGRIEPDNSSSPLVFDWKCRIMQGKFEGRILHHRTEANHLTINIIKNDLLLAGLASDNLYDIRLVQDKVIGLRFVLSSEIKEYNGQSYHSTRFVLRLKDSIDLSAHLAKEKSMFQLPEKADVFLG